MRIPIVRKLSAILPATTLLLAACSGSGNSTLPSSISGSSTLPAASGTSSLPSTATVGSSAASSKSTQMAGKAIVKRLPNADQSGQVALSADSLPGDHDSNNNFIDSIGANVKIDATSGPYANYVGVKNALTTLGIRHIRDGFVTSNPNNYESHLADLATSGIHSELVLTEHEDANNNAIMDVGATKALAYLQAGHYATSIEAIEGINEPDINQGAPSLPPPTGWAALTRSEQQTLYAGVQTLTAPAPSIKVYGPSIVNQASLQQLGDLSQYMDYGNIHNYSGGYEPPATAITSAVTSAATVAGTKPILASENGYATGSTGQAMPDLVMLDYAQRLFFKQFTHGVKRTLWYELLDENATPNDYWHNTGLLNSSLVPKPAYVGLKNVISVLADQTPYRPRTALNFSFGGQIQFENIEDLLLQKNDGSFWLVVWRDVGSWNPAANGSPGSYIAPAPVTVSNSLNFLGTYVSSITEYDEDDTGAMTNKSVPVMSGSTAQVSVGVRPRIYKIVPGTAPVVPSAPVISNPAAHWALDEAAGNVGVNSVNPAANMNVPTAPGKLSWVTGQYLAGLSINGTQATTNNVPIDTTQSFSASAWVQLNSLSGYQAAVAMNSPNQAAFAIDYTPSSNISFTTYMSDSSSAGTRIGSSAVPTIGRWYAVCVTYNATTHLMSLYIDGALQSTATSKGIFKATSNTEFGSMQQAGVGHYQWWNGGVDEVNLYQRELTPAEVATLAGK